MRKNASLREMAYLGHVVSGEGVVVDQEKIQAMLKWPIPKNLLLEILHM